MTKSFKTALLTAACLFAFTTTAPAADSFTNAQKDEINATVKAYILANPEVLIEALNSYQKKQQEEQSGKFKENFEANKDEIFKAGSPVVGNPKGDVTIVEFFDYNCGYCKKAYPDVAKLLEADKKVKIIFKEFPILSPTSHEAAAWALAANKQGKYWEFHSALMKHEGALDNAAIEAAAKTAGLDVEKARKDKDDASVKELLDKDVELANKLGIRGTPGFIVQDELNPGYMGYDALKNMVESKRKK